MKTALTILIMMVLMAGCKKDTNDSNGTVFIDSNDITWTFPDPNDPNSNLIIIDTDNSATLIFYSPKTYTPKEHLKDDCWVRALTKLAQIYEDPNIISAEMSAGWLNSFGGSVGHAWIAYTIRSNNEMITIRYDPQYDVYLEPHPNDANLLIPVVPIEPQEALNIIYGSNDVAGKEIILKL